MGLDQSKARNDSIHIHKAGVKVSQSVHYEHVEHTQRNIETTPIVQEYLESTFKMALLRKLHVVL